MPSYYYTVLEIAVALLGLAGVFFGSSTKFKLGTKKFVRFAGLLCACVASAIISSEIAVTSHFYGTMFEHNTMYDWAWIVGITTFVTTLGVLALVGLATLATAAFLAPFTKDAK